MKSAGWVAYIAALSCVFLSGPLVAESEVSRQLQARNAEFERDIIRVSEHVYTAVGYAVSPVSMIVGSDGLVIVDTGIDAISGAQIRADFASISDKPVRAVVITHGHPDHMGGLSAFIDSADVQVWVREGFESEARFLKEAGISHQRKRGAMQAGFLLSPDQRINNGVAKPYWPKRGGAVFESGHAAKPTHIASGARTRLSIAGIELDLVAADGETDDAVYVWYPEDRVVFSGDNFYKSWPNLYAIRGTGYRDVRKWALAVDAMLKEGPQAVVGGHTRPIIGGDEVKETLTNYRDAIQFVFDKTVEGMNKGLTPNQLVEYVQLPDAYLDLDYLRPYYGNPEWAIRAIFTGYLGWFDGNATNLFPLSDKEEARRIVAMAGGMDAVKAHANAALKAGDYQWALQLADYLLALDTDADAARLLKADALTELAEGTFTTTARNYYLSSAKQLRAAAARE